MLKSEIEQMNTDVLHLQQGLSQSSVALDDNLDAIIISVSDETDCICVKAGIYYAGIIAGCSCADDPTPDNQTTEYCQVLLAIDKTTAETTVTLLQEQTG
ncbi:MAG: hypothetical protein OEU91_02080 [Gammaproteobacteria bacterium]|nr:hypothetical protein [Gammaproteobacteria bacterium]